MAALALSWLVVGEDEFRAAGGPVLFSGYRRVDKYENGVEKGSSAVLSGGSRWWRSGLGGGVVASQQRGGVFGLEGGQEHGGVWDLLGDFLLQQGRQVAALVREVAAGQHQL